MEPGNLDVLTQYFYLGCLLGNVTPATLLSELSPVREKLRQLGKKTVPKLWIAQSLSAICWRASRTGRAQMTGDSSIDWFDPSSRLSGDPGDRPDQDRPQGRGGHLHGRTSPGTACCPARRGFSGNCWNCLANPRRSRKPKNPRNPKKPDWRRKQDRFRRPRNSKKSGKPWRPRTPGRARKPKKPRRLREPRNPN